MPKCGQNMFINLIAIARAATLPKRRAVDIREPELKILPDRLLRPGGKPPLFQITKHLLECLMSLLERLPVPYFTCPIFQCDLGYPSAILTWKNGSFTFSSSLCHDIPRSIEM